jgi:hypothetical protein
MQEQNQQNSSNNKEFYNTSVLRSNLVSDYINDLSSNEVVDTNVEKVNKK